MVEWYHSRGSAVNCGEPRMQNDERVGHPPEDMQRVVAENVEGEESGEETNA